MNKKLVLTSLATFVAYFLGGMLIYGFLLKSTMAGNTPEAIKPLMMDPPNMLYMALGNLVMAIMIAWVLTGTNSNTIGKGIKTAVTLNVLITLGMNLIWTSMMTMYNNPMMGMLTDVGASAGMGILAGAAGGWMLGRGDKAA